MTVLRQQMLNAMRVRGFATRTQNTYIEAVAKLARFYQASPDTLTFEQVEAWLLRQIERGLSYSTVNQASCGAFYSIRLSSKHACFRASSDHSTYSSLSESLALLFEIATVPVRAHISVC